MTISKSQYVKGSQCPKALWLSVKCKDLKQSVDPAQQAVFDAGHEIGEWAKRRFPDGVEVTAPYYDIAAGAATTANFINTGHDVIFEATAIHAADGSHARIDILRKSPDAEGWDMIEVKGSTSVKDYHLEDMSFQYRVFAGAGYRINSCFMMLINNEYIRDGDIDPERLLMLEDITEAVLANQGDVATTVPELKTTLEQPNEPQARIGARCFTPFDCDYVPHCWQGVPDYSIYNIFTGRKADEIVENLGSYEVKSLPATLYPPGHKGKDIQSYIARKIYVEPENLRRFLSGLTYPLYYLDYETIASGVPVLDGTRPFQAIPFQFSLHIEETPGAELRHHEFLHKDKTDPRPEFIAALIRLCGTAGSIIVYNQPFEKGINEALKKDFPAEAAAIEAINMRMVDLMIPFKNRWLYHPDQHSSASIKNVLPAFTDLSYGSLGIGNGLEASRQYLKFMQGKMMLEQIDQLWQDLSAYCHLDTLAMKMLMDVVMEYAASG